VLTREDVLSRELERVIGKIWKEDWVKVKSKHLAVVVRWLLFQGRHVKSTADVVRLCVDIVVEWLKNEGFKEWSLADSNLLLMSKGLRNGPFTAEEMEAVFEYIVGEKGGLK